MGATKPFFYICVGLTLSLPLFYIDLAVVEYFTKIRTVTVSTDNGHDIVSADRRLRRRLVLSDNHLFERFGS